MKYSTRLTHGSLSLTQRCDLLHLPPTWYKHITLNKTIHYLWIENRGLLSHAMRFEENSLDMQSELEKRVIKFSVLGSANVALYHHTRPCMV
jgi:hypothetical protein